MTYIIGRCKNKLKTKPDKDKVNKRISTDKKFKIDKMLIEM